MAKVWLLAATAMLTTGAGVLGWFHVDKRQGQPYVGTTIGGYLPDPTLGYSDWLEEQAERRKSHKVWTYGGKESFELSQGKLGVELDLAAMLVQAERQRERGDLGAQLFRWVAAKWGREDLVWLTRFDADRARSTLTELSAVLDVPAVDAKIELDKRHWVDARVGVKLDVEATVDWLEHQRDADMSFLPLVMREVPPSVTLAQLSPVDLRRTLAAFETGFRGHAGPRGTNIHVAAKALNGTILGPGEIFSFNRVVGPREESRGYREAPVIVDDVLEPGVGGGVCQVATTVHAAAVLAGLEVLQRRSHSRPSAYAPMGLDATVIDGQVDLRFRNPYAVPIMIWTSFPERFRLRVELLGMSIGTRFEHRSAVTKRSEYYRRVVTRDELAAGSFLRKQKGSYGYDVVSTVQAKGSTKDDPSRSYRSKYWPVPEVYWVGKGTDLKVLPPLPEGASGVQLDGVTVQGTIPKDVEARSSESALSSEDSTEL